MFHVLVTTPHIDFMPGDWVTTHSLEKNDVTEGENMRKEGPLGENAVKFKIELLVRAGGAFKERPNPWALEVRTDTL